MTHHSTPDANDTQTPSTPEEPSNGETAGPGATEADAPFSVDDEDAIRCPYCGRPFRAERLRTLHVGEAHPETCRDEEWLAYEAAVEAESDDLFVYHMKVIAALVLLFFAFIYLYAFVLV